MDEALKYQLESACSNLIPMVLTAFNHCLEKIPAPIDRNYKIEMNGYDERLRVYDSTETKIHEDEFQVPRHPKYTEQQCKDIVGIATREAHSHMITWKISMMAKNLTWLINQNSGTYELIDLQ